MPRARAAAVSARDILDGTDAGPGMVTGRTRPLCNAAIRHAPPSSTATSV